MKFNKTTLQIKPISCKFILPIMFCFASCTLVPCLKYSDMENVDFNPKKSEITGIYRPDLHTILNTKGFSDSSVVFVTKNNDIIIKNFPDNVFNHFLSENGKTKSGILSASGRWKTAFYKETARLNIELDYEGINYSNSPSWNIYKKNGTFYICFGYGDPDNCDAVRLEKINTANTP